MIPVTEALARILDLCSELSPETVPLAKAAGRVLYEPVTSRRDQPPFRTSVMDGYAVRGSEVAPGATFRVIGEAPAGHAFGGSVGPGEAVRIFTGAVVPEGADRVVIQEDVMREGDAITVTEGHEEKAYVRAAGADFRAGETVDAPRMLRPVDLSLIAAMNVAEVAVTRRPVVALMATGDELVIPGGEPRPDQIVASNAFGLKAMVEAAGAEARMLPLARDRMESLESAFRMARGADVIVTIGGASVGDHDLVAAAAKAEGFSQSFYKVAMRPGKPLMAGAKGETLMIGLPGNPVSSMVCGQVFLVPALRAMLGLGKAPAPRSSAPLAADIPANGPREHYMRAALGSDGIAPLESQDSALIGVLARADALLIRPVGDGPRIRGETVEYLPL